MTWKIIMSSNLITGMLTIFTIYTEFTLQIVNGKKLKRVVDYLIHCEQFKTKINSKIDDSIDLLNVANYGYSITFINSFIVELLLK